MSEDASVYEAGRREVGRCVTCVHWQPYANALGERMAEANPDLSGGGLCGSLKLTGGPLPDLGREDMLQGGYGDDPMWTGPQFGCVHWNGKEESA